MARTGFRLGGPGATTSRPDVADQVVAGNTWAINNVGYPVDADWVNAVKANLENLVVALGGSLSDGDDQLKNALALALALKADVATAGANQNILINGGFQVNQRGFAGGSLSAGAYGFDRWKADTGGANVSVSGYVVTLTSGTLVQVIETVMWGVASLASTALTVSVDTPSADLTVTLGSSSGTITAGSGRRSVTLTTGAGDTGDLSFKIAKASGSGVTFGRVKVEIASAATMWLDRPRHLELFMCWRYFEKSMRETVAPADGVSRTYDAFISFAGAVNTSQLYSPFIGYQNRKRTTPTITFYRTDLGASAGKWAFLTGAWTSCDTMGTPTNAEKGFVALMTVTAAPFTAGSAYGIAGAWISEAEL